MKTAASYRIFSVGDSILTLDFGNIINEDINKKIISLFNTISKEPLPGMIEAIPAYSSLSIIFDPVLIKKKSSKNITAFDWIKEQAERFLEANAGSMDETTRSIKIPVCYNEEFGTDLTRITQERKLSREEVIQLHTGKKYRVYMLGFLPGFPYMGEVDEKIAMPRKAQPQTVAAGSVGIAGKQTGIYPLSSPGGWNVVGRTPVGLFDRSKEEPTLLNPGDMVEFYAITKEEFLDINA